MKTDINKQSREYIKTVRNQMLLPSKTKKRALYDLSSGVEEYIQNNPDASIDDLTTHFGNPKTVVGEYILSLDQDELTAEIRKSKIIKRAAISIAVALIVAITAILTTFGIIVYQSKSSIPHYIDEQVIDYGCNNCR
jgi:uncharacterized membrane protein